MEEMAADSLTECQITDAGYGLIADILRINSTTTDISLEDNLISESGAIALAEGVPTMSRRDEFGLFVGNCVTDEGAVALMESFTNNTTPKLHLGLGMSKLTDEGATAIGKILERISAEEGFSLMLIGGQISDNGAIAFSEGIANNTSTCKLQIMLDATNMTIRGKLALSNTIKLRQHTTMVNWYGDNIFSFFNTRMLGEVTPSHEVARGNFGAAFKAMWGRKDTLSHEVARGNFDAASEAASEAAFVAAFEAIGKEHCILKVGFKENAREAMFESLILQIIPPHKNLCEFIGTKEGLVIDGEKHDTVLVLKEYNGGSLKTLVQNKKGILSPDIRYSYFRQMASVMCHLQHYGMIHRDLALRNFVLTEDQLTVKLIDFGLSYFIIEEGEGFPPRKNDELPFRIHPPESLIPPHNYYIESDIWLLGIAFWESYNIRGGDAFYFIGTASQQREYILTIMHEGMGEIPLMYNEHVPGGVRKLINSMCSFDYKTRPTSEDILHQIDEIEKGSAAQEEAPKHDDNPASSEQEVDQNPQEYGGLSNKEDVVNVENEYDPNIEIEEYVPDPEQYSELEEKEPAYYADWREKELSATEEISNPYAATYGEGYVTIQEFRLAEWTEFQRIIQEYREKIYEKSQK